MNHRESFGKNERTLYEPLWHIETVGRNCKGAKMWVEIAREQDCGLKPEFYLWGKIKREEWVRERSGIGIRCEADDFVADLGVAFVDDWVFLADKVVGNEKGWYWLSIDIVKLVGYLAM